VIAAPERGKANAAIAVVLAEALGCKASRVAILSGEAARDKRFVVSGFSVEELQVRLATLCLS